MESSEIEYVSPEVEMLARMWIVIDPNRYPNNSDEMITFHVDGVPGKHMAWLQMVPFGRASLDFIEKCGFRIVPAE